MRPSRSEPCLLQLLMRVPSARDGAHRSSAETPSPLVSSPGSSPPCEALDADRSPSELGGLACTLCGLQERRGALEELAESLRWLAPHIDGLERTLAAGRYRGDDEEPGASEFLDEVEVELQRIQAAWTRVEAQLEAARRAVDGAD